MQPIRQALYILATFTLLVSSCQSAQANVEQQTTNGEIPIADALNGSPSQAENTENNECLKCHSNQDQLMETVEPEPVAEAESKGVG